MVLKNRLNSFQLFNESNITDKLKKAHIYALCIKYMITPPFTIHDDMSLSVSHDVDMGNGRGEFLKFGFTKIPIKFKRVDGEFRCSNNNLYSLINSPRVVNGNFHFMNNKVNSLIGGPEYVDGFYNAYNNNIFNFIGFPEYFSGRVEFSRNPVNEILDLFSSKNQSLTLYKAINLINEYDVIQDRNVIQDRLNMVFETLNLNIPENIQLKNYKIL